MHTTSNCFQCHLMLTDTRGYGALAAEDASWVLELEQHALGNCGD